VPDPHLLPPLEPPWGQVRAQRTYGRDAIIEAVVDDWPRESGNGRALVLCGVGGVGKTSVALEVCRAARSRRCDAWWVSAVDKASFEAGMRAVGYAAGASPEAFAQANHADVVWRVLSGRERPWVLVIDDADDVSALSGAGTVADESGWVRRPPPNGLILVTSRDGSRSTWRWLVPRKVEPLSPEDGARVLLDLAPSAGGAAEAAALAAQLGGLPQLLHLAGSALAENSRIPEAWIDSSYLRTFRDYGLALQSQGGGRVTKDLEALFRRVWDISFGQIDKLELPHARAVLLLLCCFEDGPLPYVRVLDPGLLAATGLIPGLTPAALLAAIEGLDGLGLLTLSDGAGKSAPGHEGPVLRIPDVMLAAARAHPELRDLGGPGYRRVAGRLLLNSLGDHVTAAHTDGSPAAARRLPGPVPRTVRAVTADAQRQSALVALERMLERQIDTYDEELDLTVEVGDDDADLVTERRTTRMYPGFICRSVQPVTPDHDRRVRDLSMEFSGPRHDPPELFAFLGTTGRPRVVAFLPPQAGPTRWVVTYRSPGLFRPLRSGELDYMYYDTRGPRRGSRPTLTHFTIRFVFGRTPGKVREALGRGTIEVVTGDRSTSYVWRADTVEGEKYFWQLWT
jgi:hypothetical protein